MKALLFGAFLLSFLILVSCSTPIATKTLTQQTATIGIPNLNYKFTDARQDDYKNGVGCFRIRTDKAVYGMT